MGSRAAVLAVGHDASRTGAPTVALTWLGWARRHDVADVAVLLAAGGPLVEDLRWQAPTRVVDFWLWALASGAWSAPVPPSLAAGVQRVAGTWARRGRWGPGDPIVVANTVAAWSLAATVRPRSRLVLWLHELDRTVARVLASGQRDHLLAQTDHIVAVAPAVATMAIERWGYPAEQVTVVPPFVDPPAATERAPTGSHDLVAIGSLSERKAPDLFVAVAAEVRRQRGELRSAWVGGPLDGPTATMVRRDLTEAALVPPMDLPGDVTDPHRWLPADGVLVHLAREDPAPLAVLEAAQRGVPVVTWADTGAADLAVDAERPDLTIARGDVVAMARRVTELLGSRDQRAEAGAALAAVAGQRTTARLAPRLQAAIEGGAR